MYQYLQVTAMDHCRKLLTYSNQNQTLVILIHPTTPAMTLNSDL